jgi:hypothetical protein
MFLAEELAKSYISEVIRLCDHDAANLEGNY